MPREGAIFDPVKGQRYVGKVTQSGTGAPALTAAVENTLVLGTPTPARSGVGVYTLTLTGAFTVGKTFVQCVPSGAAARIFHSVYTSVNVITLNVFDAAVPGAADSGDFDLAIFVYD